MPSEYPIRTLTFSHEGNYLAVLDEQDLLSIYQLDYSNVKLQIKLIQKIKTKNVLSISLGRMSHLVINYPKEFRLLNVSERMKEFNVRHPDHVTYYEWRLGYDDDQTVALLTICHSVLRVWRRKKQGSFVLVGAKFIPNNMQFTWLQNRYFNASEKLDYLICIHMGDIHFWSVSGLDDQQNVIISTLRTIPGIYNLRSECKIQVRPCYSRLANTDAAQKLKKSQSMVSLSPSITTSLNMSPIIGPRLYLDVIHRTGELNTVVLTASGAGFSETTSVKTHFQAGGHDAKITNLIRHPSVPLLLTTDEDNNSILWRCQNGRLEQLSKYKLRKTFQLYWLDVSPTNQQLFLGVFSNCFPYDPLYCITVGHCGSIQPFESPFKLDTLNPILEITN